MKGEELQRILDESKEFSVKNYHRKALSNLLHIEKTLKEENGVYSKEYCSWLAVLVDVYMRMEDIYAANIRAKERLLYVEKIGEFKDILDSTLKLAVIYYFAKEMEQCGELYRRAIDMCDKGDISSLEKRMLIMKFMFAPEVFQELGDAEYASKAILLAEPPIEELPEAILSAKEGCEPEELAKEIYIYVSNPITERNDHKLIPFFLDVIRKHCTSAEKYLLTLEEFIPWGAKLICDEEEKFIYDWIMNEEALSVAERIGYKDEELAKRHFAVFFALKASFRLKEATEQLKKLSLLKLSNESLLHYKLEVALLLPRVGLLKEAAKLLDELLPLTGGFIRVYISFELYVVRYVAERTADAFIQFLSELKQLSSEIDELEFILHMLKMAFAEHRRFYISHKGVNTELWNVVDACAEKFDMETFTSFPYSDRDMAMEYTGWQPPRQFHYIAHYIKNSEQKTIYYEPGPGL